MYFDNFWIEGHFSNLEVEKCLLMLVVTFGLTRIEVNVKKGELSELE